MKKIMLLLVGLLLIWSLPAGALTLITEIDQDRLENTDTYDGEFNNSGALLGVFEGNDSNQWGDIESWLDVQLTESFKTEFGEAGEAVANKSGEWSTTDPIQFYIVKSTNAFALYEEVPFATSGTWSTYDLWLRDLGGDGGIEISHLTAAAPVPEPATMLLLGVGLMGIAGLGRKKLIKKQ